MPTESSVQNMESPHPLYARKGQLGLKVASALKSNITHSQG